MDIQTLTTFFMWCTIINGALFMFWAFAVLLAPDRVYQTQQRWVSLPRETYDIIIYAFLGLFKVVFIIFNLVPFIALLIVK